MGTESTSRQNLTLEEGKVKKTKGWFVKPATAVFLLALAVAAVVAVGLIVWFAAPREKCTRNDTTRKDACKRYMDDHGPEAICQGYTGGKSSEGGDADNKKKDDKTAPVTGLTLNGTYIPSHYVLELWPRFYEGDDFGFNGSVLINVKVMKNTDVIILHLYDITVHNSSIKISLMSGNLETPLTVNRTEEDTDRQFYKIYASTSFLENATYIISMTFNGTLIHPDWHGMYRSSFMENNTKFWLVSTQFETTHARRAFPCFDEPSLKATFDVTLVRLSNYSSISNMPINKTIDRGEGWMADVYDTTVVMPTYLLAFVVSNFVYVEDPSPELPKMRIYTRPTFKKYAEYANSISRKILKALGEWTGIPYSLPKMDQIAVPDFAAGAMENWGLVTYRETALLYNPDFTDMSDKRWVASVVAHEFAHQWWGNLVTCHWWDNIFLNEGFATYFGDLVGLNEVETTWQMDEFFIRRVQYIMGIDGRHSSQPIYITDIDHHDSHRKAFHRITYYKGASILRMVKYFLGEDTFQKAIQKYLTKYSYKTARKEDLYDELQKQAELDNKVTWLDTKRNISQILDTWIEQMNLPIVQVTDLRTGTVRVEQMHFRADKTKNVSHPSYLGEFIWDIPLTYITESDNAVKLKWMHRDTSINLEGLPPADWKLFNLYSQGFYRVKYDYGTWGALLNQLMTAHTVIPVENRAQLLDDAFAMAAAGEFEDLEALRATQYMYKEEEYLPWYPALRGRTGYYLDMFYGKPAYSLLENYLMNLTIPMYNASGWDVTDNDKHLDRYTRSMVIGEACYRGYKPCIDKARSLYTQFMGNPDVNPIHPDLRSTVYCIALSYGGSTEWEFLRSLYQKDYGDVYIAYENSTVSSAMGCARQPHVIRTMLDFAYDYNLTSIFVSLAGARHGKDIVWSYIMERWDDFVVKNETRISRAAVLKTLSDAWNTDRDLKKLDVFTSNYNMTGLNKTIEDIKETTNKNKVWLEENLDKMEDWLESLNKGPDTGTRRKRRSAGTALRPVAAGHHRDIKFSMDEHRSSHTV